MRDSHYDTLYTTELNHWWYKARRRLVHELIVRYSEKDRPIILDVGCGTGALLKELSSYGDVHGVDPSPKAVSYCLSRGIIEVKEGSVESIPHQNDKFDIVLALDILEHVEDDQAGVNEIYRVLKKGGIGIIFVPTFSFLWGVTDEISHHHRRYRLSSLMKLFDHSHFNILRHSYFNFFLFLPILIIRSLVKFLHIPLESENKLGVSLFNPVLYTIFYLEILLLKFVSFPFGVSGMLVAKKI